MAPGNTTTSRRGKKRHGAAAEAAAAEAAKQACLQQKAADRAIAEQLEQQLLEDPSLQAPTGGTSSGSSTIAATGELSQDGQDPVLWDSGPTSTVATPPATPTAGHSVRMSLEDYHLI
ncbi:hypothetical protein HDV00_012843 [Rhizophlyctis rosea]|nr:hypothetical protein HDV00_012843 [Rhizophlyctis rosea]